MLRHLKIFKIETHYCPQNFVSPAIMHMKFHSPGKKSVSLAKQQLSLVLLALQLLQTFFVRVVAETEQSSRVLTCTLESISFSGALCAAVM